jgi:hypothetical protein
MPPPLARTNREAHAYMDLHPCDACGETRFSPDSSVIMADGDLASRYHGPCPACGTHREFVFRIPGEVLLPPADRIRFGDDHPSELIDAGQWLWLADHISTRTPADLFTVQPESLDKHRLDMTAATAAVEEVLKFIPPGADQLPAKALWTQQGQEVYQTRPSRFVRGSLLAVRDAYQELVDTYTQRITVPPLRVEYRQIGFDASQYHYVYQDRPLTGEMIEPGVGDVPMAVSEFRDGLRHGMSRVYFPDGRLHSEARYEYGEPVGADRTWYHNGQLQEEIAYTDQSKYVSTRRWSEDGTLAYTHTA